MEKHDVVIVGAGPGGLHAAKILAEHGKDVLVLEKLPKNDIGDKACCCGLPPRVVNMLNVPQNIIEIGFDDWNLIIHSSRYTTTIEKGSFPCAFSSRRKLGQYQLKEAEKAGAEIRAETNVLGIDKNKNEVSIKNSDPISYTYLIGADGANSKVRRSLGLQTENYFSTIYTVNVPCKDMELYTDYDKYGFGAAWIFPHNRYMTIGNLVHHVVHHPPMNQIDSNLHRLCSERDIDLSEAKKRGGPISIKFVGFRFKNIYLVGDAAGMSSAICGEGIYQSAKSGELAAREICGENIKPELNDFMQFIRKHDLVRKGLKMCDILPSSFSEGLYKLALEYIIPIGGKFSIAIPFVAKYYGFM